MDEIYVDDYGTTEVLATYPEVAVETLDTVDQELIFLGDTGPQGLPGRGIPPGGTVGQYYRKASSADYDGEWTSVDGADSTYSQAFSGSSVTVTHNLGKYPAVTIRTSAGDEVEGDVDHLNVNQLQVSFAASFSGVVHCN